MNPQVAGIIGLVVAAAIIVGVVVLAKRMGTSTRDTYRERLENAHDAYQAALSALKVAPSDADAKQQALAAGREYSNLARLQRGVTIFDEMALMNDINAATAGAAAAGAVAAASVEDRLKTLDDLRSKGVISDQEYAARRQKIVDAL